MEQGWTRDLTKFERCLHFLVVCLIIRSIAWNSPPRGLRTAMFYCELFAGVLVSLLERFGPKSQNYSQNETSSLALSSQHLVTSQSTIGFFLLFPRYSSRLKCSHLSSHRLHRSSVPSTPFWVWCALHAQGDQKRRGKRCPPPLRPLRPWESVWAAEMEQSWSCHLTEHILCNLPDLLALPAQAPQVSLDCQVLLTEQDCFKLHTTVYYRCLFKYLS